MICGTRKKKKSFEPMEYDDQIVRQIIECVIVESKEQIRVIFAGGLEVTQSLI